MTRPPGPLLVRADAGVSIGLGHAMRCLALAQAWQDHCGPARFLLPLGVETVVARVQREGIDVEINPSPPGSVADAEWTARSAEAAGAAWVAADGYAFATDFQRRVRAVRRLLVVDDVGHLPFYEANALLNQNIDAESIEYACPADTTRLLGTRYALLRREFSETERPHRQFGAGADKLLVVMGGSDPQDLTGRILEALSMGSLSGVEVTAVVGPQNPHRERLERLARRLSDLSASSRAIAASPDRMRPLLESADLAISAAGSTSWEIAYLGTPALLVEAFPNQENIARGLDRVGAAINLGPPDGTFEERLTGAVRKLRASPGLRRGLSEAAMALVDGEGAARAIQAIAGLPVRLRKARQADAATLFRWANDPSVRQSSFSPDPIPWENHEAWFREKLRHEGTFFFVGVDPDDTPSGVLRFDVSAEGEAEVDIAVDAAKRGLGVGAVMLGLGIRRLSRVPSVRTIAARVRMENAASRSLFAKAGFREEGTAAQSAFPSVRYVRRVVR